MKKRWFRGSSEDQGKPDTPPEPQVFGNVYVNYVLLFSVFLMVWQLGPHRLGRDPNAANQFSQIANLPKGCAFHMQTIECSSSPPSTTQPGFYTPTG